MGKCLQPLLWTRHRRQTAVWRKSWNKQNNPAKQFHFDLTQTCCLLSLIISRVTIVMNWELDWGKISKEVLDYNRTRLIWGSRLAAGKATAWQYCDKKLCAVSRDKLRLALTSDLNGNNFIRSRQQQYTSHCFEVSPLDFIIY